MTGLPPLNIVEGSDRFPPIDPLLWTADMGEAVAELVASPRGEMRGPFVPLLRSPGLLDRAQKLGAFIRYECSIEPRLREFAICVVARFWSQPYEWNAHARLAKKEGVALATLSSLRDGQSHPDMPVDELLVFDCCTKLLVEHQLDDQTFERAVTMLREQTLIDLAGLCGYYTMLAMVMNLARTPFEGVPFALPN